MKKTLEAFFDDLQIIHAEIDLHYYNGFSKHFKVIDEDQNYYDVTIKGEKKTDTKRIYDLYVEGLTIGKAYTLVDEHFLRTNIQYRYVVRTDAFDQMYFYHGKDLGPTYSQEATSFKVWAPTASRVILDLNETPIEMLKEEKGVFSATVEGDHDLQTYKYVIQAGGEWRSAIDPYALSSTPNHGLSVVIDPGKCHVDLNKKALQPLEQKTDSVIYELHVRDFSSDPDNGIANKGKFLGLTEEGTTLTSGQKTGIDYVADLGITHVQLLPIYDFGSVDELNQFKQYNWGYDPVQYNVPEGSYASDVTDPYSRIIDLKKAISKIHEKGMRVNMDVVYNHMFDRFTSSFENIVPYYYFRMNQEGKISNGSYCGNDFDSTRKMGRKFVLESIEHWMNFYGIDGFRFDLMGILDVETMNQVADLVEDLDPSAMVYGEGWNMPTQLAEDKKATMMNQDQMPKISHFNDFFRDTIKGGSMEDEARLKGVCLGDLKFLPKVTTLLSGSPLNADKKTLFDTPVKSVNYVECHDNQTVFDKMMACDIPESEKSTRQKLMIGMVMFSQGIPFIHAGQEFLRTKGGDHNSYMSSDEVNHMDWSRTETHSDVVDYLKAAIEIRKSYDVFRQTTFSDQIKGKLRKLKKLVEMDYNKTMRMVINFGQAQQIKLKNEEVIFNATGHTSQKGDTYGIQPLELIIIKKL